MAMADIPSNSPIQSNGRKSCRVGARNERGREACLVCHLLKSRDLSDSGVVAGGRDHGVEHTRSQYFPRQIFLEC